MIQKQIRWNPFLSFFTREIHRFLKVFFQTVFIPVINSSLYLIIFGVSLGSRLNLDGNTSYLQFLIPGLVMMSCLSNAFQNGSSSILSLKFGGDIIDIKASPLNIYHTLWALALGGMCRGFLVGVVVFTVGQCFHFYYLGMWITPYSFWVLIFFSLVAGLVFSKVGVAVALWAKTFDHIGAIGGLIILPLTYLGGVFFSLDMLSPFWKSVSLVNPILYFINGMRWGVIGESDVNIQVSILVSLLALVICHFIVLIFMKYGSYQRW